MIAHKVISRISTPLLRSSMYIRPSSSTSTSFDLRRGHLVRVRECSAQPRLAECGSARSSTRKPPANQVAYTSVPSSFFAELIAHQTARRAGRPKGWHAQSDPKQRRAPCFFRSVTSITQMNPCRRPGRWSCFLVDYYGIAPPVDQVFQRHHGVGRFRNAGLETVACRSL